MVLYSLWCWLNNCCSKEDSLSKKTLSENPTTPTSMPYYSDPTAAAYGAPPLTSTNDAIGRSNRSNNNRKNTAVRDISNTRDVKLGTVGDITDAGDVKIGSNKQTIFNEHTTNFIVCCLDSLKPFDV